MEYFRGCAGLRELPETFKIPEGVTNMNSMFERCGIQKLPENFRLPSTVTDLQRTFHQSGLEKLPENFIIPYGVVNMYQTFLSSKLTELPQNFEIPETVTNIGSAFGCVYLNGGVITIKANPTNYAECFSNVANKTGLILTVNYSKNCTNIDEILESGYTSYVKKGECIDEDEGEEIVATN